MVAGREALASIREVFIGAIDVGLYSISALKASVQIIPDIQGGKKRPTVPSKHTMMNIHRKIRSNTIATYFQSSLTCPKANTQCGSTFCHNFNFRNLFSINYVFFCISQLLVFIGLCIYYFIFHTCDLIPYNCIVWQVILVLYSHLI